MIPAPWLLAANDWDRSVKIVTLTTTQEQAPRPAEGRPASPGPLPIPWFITKAYIGPGMTEYG